MMEKEFENSLFDVEHAISMYADSYFTLAAETIYDKNLLKEYEDVIRRCHIYIIGLLPKISLVAVTQENRSLKLVFTIFGKDHELLYDLPDDFNLVRDNKDMYYLQDTEGQKLSINEHSLAHQVSQQSNDFNFEVKYIGQAYGKDGSRNAIDRLLKHETLQKIALKGIPEGYKLSLLLLEIQPQNQLITLFNPFAKIKDEEGVRKKAGLDKLFDTTEQERISLYEAALIRYFSPQFNKEFKKSFPSTNLKILHDCYEKDFSAVVAEICFDEFPFQLCSESVQPQHYHIAKYDLHKDSARKFFFSYPEGADDGSSRDE